MRYPKWLKVHQELDRTKVENPAPFLSGQLKTVEGSLSLTGGERIAVTAGSRYISNLPAITRSVLDFLKSRGAEPFLVPAMGSHGGATSAGQKKVLEDLGITEKSMGVPILSSMEVVPLGTVEGIPLFFDKNAHEADAIVAINRVKAHQFFKGDIQSGLNKMLALGLGKKEGADAIHASGKTDILGRIGDFIRSRVPILFGVAILENSYDETREISVVHPKDFNEIDRRWALESRTLMPKIPFRELDLVIVEQMGKDISGSGMDTNVIGFTRRTDRSGKVAVPLAVLDLTARSDGNAMGIGLADLTTVRLTGKIDRVKTAGNVIATGVYSAGRVPIALENERDILDVLLSKLEHPERARIVRVKNTLNLEEFYATEPLIEEIENNAKLSRSGVIMDSSFDADGYLDID